MPYRFILKILILLFLLSYPVLVYVGLAYIDIRWIAMGLLAAMVARGLMLPKNKRYLAWGFIAVGGGIAALVYFFNDPLYLRIYPVLMSALMFGIFLVSLYSPPSVIELFARLSFNGEVLPDYVVAYTRNVTKLWCVFFVLNGMVATYTIFRSLEIWTLYNGLISYLLMGTLLFSEFVYRHLVVKKRHADNG